MELPANPSKSLARLNPELFGINQRTAPAASDGKLEGDLHDEIEQLCRKRGWLYVHSRMDRPSTIAVGFPDFVIFMQCAKTVFLECKRPGAKATTAQLAKLAHARKLGFVAEIVDNMADAMEILQRVLTAERAKNRT